MKRPHTLSLAGWLAIFVATATAADLTPSLVRDGGMETWLEVKPEQALFNRLKTLQVSRADNGSILMPSAYEQGAVTLVEREEKDAASGRFALRLKGDSFYFREGFPNAYAARRGDIYVSRFMAKGTGTAAIMLTVYGGGSAYTLDQKGKPQPDTWTLIEQRILIGGASPDRIYPRLAVTGDVLIDDVFLGRVLRKEDAVAAQAVPKEFDERIAFAAAATKPPAIDGRLDDECWKSATPFSGFRVTSEQGLLVPEQASARVAYDPEAVYLGIEVPLADADRVLADLESAARRGDPTADAYSARHSVEVFLQPPGQARYVQCVASLDGCRFDGTGVGKDNFAWNGQWTFGVHAAKQGWTLEMRIPAGDLTLPKIESAEGWRLNLVDNRDGPYGTWAAVGNNFHNPFGFGALVTRDFAVWRQDKLAAWDTLRRTIADAAARLRLDVTDRLDRAARFAESLPAPAADKQLDWQTVTRTYARMNFVDAVYRAMEAEISYADVLSTATDAKASPGIMGVTKGAVALAVPPGGLREEGPAVRDAAEGFTKNAVSEQLAAGTNTVRIVCFGDSITGIYYHTGGRRAYCDMLEEALKKIYPAARIEMINAGKSGDTTPQALARMDQHVLSKKPDMVVIMFGMNDCHRPNIPFRENLKVMASRCREINAEVVLCTPNSIYPKKDTIRTMDKVATSAEAVRTVAKEMSLPLADCHQAFENVRATDQLEWKFLMSDLIHPNMNGHKLFAEVIAETISGKRVKLDDVPPYSPSLPYTFDRLAGKQPLNVIAMPPYDQILPKVLRHFYPDAAINITPWPVTGKTLADIEEWAKGIRKAKPDLVAVAIPAKVQPCDEEGFARAYTVPNGVRPDEVERYIRPYASILNSTLDYAKQTWDTFAILPAVTDIQIEPDDVARAELARRVIVGQDIGVVERAAGDNSTTHEILLRWVQGEQQAWTDSKK